MELGINMDMRCEVGGALGYAGYGYGGWSGGMSRGGCDMYTDMFLGRRGEGRGGGVLRIWVIGTRRKGKGKGVGLAHLGGGGL